MNSASPMSGQLQGSFWFINSRFFYRSILNTTVSLSSLVSQLTNDSPLLKPKSFRISEDTNLPFSCCCCFTSTALYRQTNRMLLLWSIYRTQNRGTTTNWRSPVSASIWTWRLNNMLVLYISAKQGHTEKCIFLQNVSHHVQITCVVSSSSL